MQLTSLLLIVLAALLCTVSAFRGGHGRPLYGVIGGAQSVEGAIPLRGFASYGGRGQSRTYDQW